MNLSPLATIVIAICSGAAALAFKYYSIFNRFVKYFYSVVTIFLFFLLGWNFSLLYNNFSKGLIDWTFMIALSSALIVVYVIHIIAATIDYKKEHYKW